MLDKILKVICVVVAFLLILFSGCSGEKASSEITGELSSDFRAEYRGMKLEGRLDSDGHGLQSVTITSPKTLEGLSVENINSQIHIKLGSLLCSADEAYVPQRSFSTVIADIFDVLTSGAYSITQNDDVLTASFKLPQGECVAEADLDGNLKSAEVADAELKIEFIS